MSEKRDLAIVGLLLGLLGGALILARSLGPFEGHLGSLTLSDVVGSAVSLILGIAILFGSVLIYRGRYSTGGVLNLVLGIVALLVADQLGGILALISGVVGLVANEARS